MDVELLKRFEASMNTGLRHASPHDEEVQHSMSFRYGLERVWTWSHVCLANCRSKSQVKADEEVPE